jgi:hypothetical protein
VIDFKRLEQVKQISLRNLRQLDYPEKPASTFYRPALSIAPSHCDRQTSERCHDCN